MTSTVRNMYRREILIIFRFVGFNNRPYAVIDINNIILKKIYRSFCLVSQVLGFPKSKVKSLFPTWLGTKYFLVILLYHLLFYPKQKYSSVFFKRSRAQNKYVPIGVTYSHDNIDYIYIH